MRTAKTRPAAADATGILGMTWIPGGELTMGPDASYPEERPVRRVAVERFWVDTRPVTIADLHGFVTASGFETVGEQSLCAADSPDTDPDPLVLGSPVLLRTAAPADLCDDVRCVTTDTSTAHIAFRCVIPPGPLLARPGIRPAHGGPMGNAVGFRRGRRRQRPERWNPYQTPPPRIYLCSSSAPPLPAAG